MLHTPFSGNAHEAGSSTHNQTTEEEEEEEAPIMHRGPGALLLPETPLGQCNHIPMLRGKLIRGQIKYYERR